MMSIIFTQPPKGCIYLTTIQPKGEIEALRFAKVQLEELMAEYGFIKQKYILDQTVNYGHQKNFDLKCIVEDSRRGNLFA